MSPTVTVMDDDGAMDQTASSNALNVAPDGSNDAQNGEARDIVGGIKNTNSQPISSMTNDSPLSRAG